MNAGSLYGTSSQMQYSSLFASVSFSHTKSSGTSATSTSAASDNDVDSSNVDTVNISLESLEMSSSSSAQTSSSSNVSGTDSSNGSDMQNIVKMIKDEMDKLKQNLVSTLLGLDKGTTGTTPTSGTTQAQDVTDGIQGLPAYWGSEQTSQRIVDFATSFSGLTGQAGKDFYNTMVTAIEKGFKDAAGEIGSNVPSQVSDLTNKTETLVLNKLKAWAQSNGIQVDDTSSSTQSQTPTGSSIDIKA